MNIPGSIRGGNILKILVTIDGSQNPASLSSLARSNDVEAKEKI
jgi:hypothetical protein